MDRIGARGTVGGTRRSRAVWVMLVVAGLLAGAVPGRAADLNVPADHATIQAAIDAAETDDTVHVAAGTYNESLSIQFKTIDLIGAGAGQTIIQPGSGRCLYMRSANGAVSGFTFTGGSETDGGGIYLYAAGPTISNCVITGCSATSRGGGIFFLNSSYAAFISCVVVDNTASQGGGMFMYSSAPTLTNLTMTNNAGGGIDATGGNGGNPPTTNCIIWGNTDGDDVNIPYTPAISYSDIGTGATGGTGNISADPLFADPANGDYHLLAGSPCIDAADGTAAPATDLDGNERVDVDSAPNSGVGPPWADIGAYEFAAVNQAPEAQPDAYATDEDTILDVAAPGVLDNDTDIDGDTLQAVLVDHPTRGSVTLDSQGSFTYSPDVDFYGEDSFTYYATDGALDSGVVTVTITVNAINDAPDADGDGPYLGVAELPVEFDGSGSSDVEGDPLTFHWDFGDGGTLTTTEPKIEYTYMSAGTYTVSLVVNDGELDSDTYTTEATIGEPGGGMRSDVDAFLAYVQPTERRTVLPAGTTSYDVQIVYGPTIDPSTFRAYLGRTPLSGFNPQPGTTETVTVALPRRLNLLFFRCEGERVDGKTAVDRDLFLFFIQR